MAQTSLTGPTLISQPGDLRRLAAHLSTQSILAVDTESNSLYAYRERVCLVQISTLQADYLVDPLALVDLAPLGPVFAAKDIEKVFHAAEYDLICLRRDFGFQVENLFDTMVAARILGRTAIGLGSILEAEFGLRLDKRFQRANWGQRPLPPELVNYAGNDSRYLIQLRHRLHAELLACERWSLALEDFQRLAHASPPEANPASDPACRVTGAYDLPPRQYTVLKQLCAYRDQVARQIDRPLFKVMGDKTLLAIAQACPTSLDQLKELEGMSRTQVERHGSALLRAVQRGLSAPLQRPTRNRRPDDSFLKRLDALRTWRKNAAQAMHVESDVVLPRDLVQALAEQNPQDAAGLGAVLSSTPWRLEHLGPQILQVLTGQPSTHP